MIRTRIGIVVVVGCLVGAAGGCASSGEDRVAPPAQSEAVGDRVTVGDREPAGDPVVRVVDDPFAGTASLADIAGASDLVLVGRATTVETGVQLGGGLPPYSLITLEPQEVIQGSAPPAPIKVLIQTLTGTGRLIVVEGRPEFTDEASVWMLTRVDPTFERPAGEYVLTSTSGVIPGEGGEVQFGLDGLTPSQVQAQELGTIDKVVDKLAP